jgi:GYF domain 2/Domain of unknown function (DUF4190)
MTWFYAQGGQRIGPVEWETLQDLAASGRLQRSDLVWSEGMSAWQPASWIPDLFPPLPEGAPPPPLPAAPVDPAMRWILPVGRSPWAIAAGYFGLFSLVGCGAPFALFTGIMALREIKRKPGLGGRGRAIFGIVMGCIGLLGIVLAIIGYVAEQSK